MQHSKERAYTFFKRRASFPSSGHSLGVRGWLPRWRKEWGKHQALLRRMYLPGTLDEICRKSDLERYLGSNSKCTRGFNFIPPGSTFGFGSEERIGYRLFSEDVHRQVLREYENLQISPQSDTCIYILP